MNAPTRFWVVGGEYADTSFSRLVDGTHCLIGPFDGRQDAHRVWRTLAFATTAQATVRFSILEQADLMSTGAVPQP